MISFLYFTLFNTDETYTYVKWYSFIGNLIDEHTNYIRVMFLSHMQFAYYIDWTKFLITIFSLDKCAIENAINQVSAFTLTFNQLEVVKLNSHWKLRSWWRAITIFVRISWVVPNIEPTIQVIHESLVRVSFCRVLNHSQLTRKNQYFFHKSAEYSGPK